MAAKKIETPRIEKAIERRKNSAQRSIDMNEGRKTVHEKLNKDLDNDIKLNDVKNEINQVGRFSFVNRKSTPFV